MGASFQALQVGGDIMDVLIAIGPKQFLMPLHWIPNDDLGVLHIAAHGDLRVVVPQERHNEIVDAKELPFDLLSARQRDSDRRYDRLRWTRPSSARHEPGLLHGPWVINSGR